MDISGFELLMFIILGAIVGSVVVMLFIRLKNSNNSEETKKIIEDCLEDLVDMLNIALKVLDKSKYKDELEYEEAITKMVIDNFKHFLKEHEILPTYIINSISDELLYNMIDKASEILENRMKKEELETSTEIIEEEVKNESDVPNINKTDITGTLDTFYNE